MNSVLLTTVAPSSTTPQKTTSPRAASDSSTSPEDASGFAGVLANQAAPQQQNSATPAAGQSATSSAHTDTHNGTTTETTAASQRGQHGEVTDKQQDAGKSAQMARASDPESVLAGLHGPDSENGTATQRYTDAAKTVGNTTADATLPERFSQVIAAMSKIKGNVENDAQDVKSNGFNTLTALSDASQRLAALGNKTDGHDPLLNDRTRSIQSTMQHQIHTARDLLRADAGTDTRTPGRFTTGMPSFGAEPTSFNLTDSQRGQVENNSLHTLQNITPASDSLLSSNIAPVTGFSLIPGSASSGDIMITTAAVNQPVHSPHWAPELSRQFISVIRPGENGHHSAELRLDPPELGPLRITININDSVVQALFTSAHSSVRSAVEQALPQLQQQLEHEGLSLGHASVDHDDGTSDSYPQHNGTGVAGSRDDALSTTAMSPVRQRAPDALVDTFA